MARDLGRLLGEAVAFDWDAGNAPKLWRRHQVGPNEAEEAMLNRPIVVVEDSEHSAVEPRYYALGRTNEGRLLFLVFTIRAKRIRFVTARDMNRKERRVYGEANP